MLISPVDNLQKKLDELIQCPGAVLILEHHVLPAGPSPLSPFVPITTLQGRFYNFPGADAEKEVKENKCLCPTLPDYCTAELVFELRVKLVRSNSPSSLVLVMKVGHPSKLPSDNLAE